MNLLIFALLFSCNLLFASADKTLSSKELKIKEVKEEPPRFTEYLHLYKQFAQALGPTGNWKEGEIEIVLDPAKIKEVEAKCKQNLMMKRGLGESEAEKWSRVGIIAEDGYWMWVRDAVIFPSGSLGTYNRILWKSSLKAPPGVAVMPVLENGKILLNLNYRHATRSWELELPRGARSDGETLEQTAIRELEEETGCEMIKPILLGKMATDSGLSTSLVPIFLAKVSKQGKREQDDSEAIQANLSFTKEELRQALANGYMEIEIKGNTIRVPCRDSFLAFGLLLAETKALLN
jgi:ADP-ribose pyrophosphatase